MNLSDIKPRRLTAGELLIVEQYFRWNEPTGMEEMLLEELAWTRQRLRDLEEKLGDWHSETEDGFSDPFDPENIADQDQRDMERLDDEVSPGVEGEVL